MGLEKNKKFKEELMMQSISLGISEQVEWMGFADQMKDEYLNASFINNFSDSESFSLTCLEALYFGRPVIATRCGGPEEIIDENESGYLVPMDDVKAMSQAMRQLMSNRDLIEKMGQVGYEAVRRKFSRVHIKQEIIKVLQSALEDKIKREY